MFVNFAVACLNKHFAMSRGASSTRLGGVGYENERVAHGMERSVQFDRRTGRFAVTRCVDQTGLLHTLRAAGIWQKARHSAHFFDANGYLTPCPYNKGWKGGALCLAGFRRKPAQFLSARLGWRSSTVRESSSPLALTQACTDRSFRGLLAPVVSGRTAKCGEWHGTGYHRWKRCVRN